jgi:transposase
VATDVLPRGYTVRELAQVWRVSPDRIRAWIARGELTALNTADAACGRPRYVILPHHLAAWEQRHRAGPTPKPPRRRNQTDMVDYFPD